MASSLEVMGVRILGVQRPLGTPSLFASVAARHGAVNSIPGSAAWATGRVVD
jgi:hypothetical protein